MIFYNKFGYEFGLKHKQDTDEELKNGINR
jgi:hypothetical protein